MPGKHTHKNAHTHKHMLIHTAEIVLKRWKSGSRNKWLDLNKRWEMSRRRFPSVPSSLYPSIRAPLLLSSIHLTMDGWINNNKKQQQKNDQVTEKDWNRIQLLPKKHRCHYEDVEMKGWTSEMKTGMPVFSSLCPFSGSQPACHQSLQCQVVCVSRKS